MNKNEKRVLEIIKEDPYISQKEIGEKLNLTRSTIATIISSMTQKNIIKGRAYVLNENQGDIFVIGGMNLDRKFILNDNLVMYTSNPATSETFVGGVGRNIGENLGRLGHKVSLVSIAGFDHVYDFIKNNTGPYVDFSNVKQVENYSTGTYSAVLDSSGEMVLAIADMSIYDKMDLDFIQSYNSILKKARLIVIDLNLPKETVSYLLEFCRINDIPLIVIPVSGPKINRLPKNIQGVSFLVVNQDESEAFFETTVKTEEDFNNLADMWVKAGAAEVVITRGKNSSIYKNKDGIKKNFHPPITDDVVDVTGAGDSYSSGLIHGILEGYNFDEAIELAMTNSYYTIQSKKQWEIT